jgi:porin
MVKLGENPMVRLVVVIAVARLGVQVAGGDSDVLQQAAPGMDKKAQPTTRPAVGRPDPNFSVFPLEDYTGELWIRSKLLGDWAGLRTDLDEKGVQFKLELLQFMQGNAHGGKSTNDAFEYWGSADYILKLDTNRMGLWPGGAVTIRGETEFGHDINKQVGAVSPVNFDSLLPMPDDPGLTTLTEFWVLQALSKQVFVMAGKMDLSRLPGGNVFAGDPYTQFMNASLWQPVVSFAQVPYTAMAAGAGIMPTKWFNASTIVLDSYSTPTRTGFDTAFHTPNGMTLLEALTFDLKPFTKIEGHQRLNFSYSNRDRLDLHDLQQALIAGMSIPGFDRLYFPPDDLYPKGKLANLGRRLVNKTIGTLLEPEPRPDDWCFWYDFDQFLYTKPGDPNQGIGLFGRFGWSPDRTNMIQTFYNIGVGGKGMVPTRNRDSYGVGYYYLDFNDGLKFLGIQAEQGIEMYYNIEVTKWLHVTPDLQVIINPGGSDAHDVAIVYGIRAQMSF